MSDQVKIGGDSKELIKAIDAAEQRFKRFEHAVSGTTAPEGFKKRIVDNTTAAGLAVEKSGAAARKAAVDWKRLGDESKRAAEHMAGAGKRAGRTAADFRPARPGQYADPIALEDQARLAEFAAARARASRRHSPNPRAGGGIGAARGMMSARIAGDIINLGTASSGAVMKVTALSHALGGVGPAVGVVAAGVAFKKIRDLARESEIAVRHFRKELEKNPTDVVTNLDAAGILEQLGRVRELAKKARESLGSVNSESSLGERIVAPFRKLAAEPRARRNVDLAEEQRRLELEEALTARGSEQLEIAKAAAAGQKEKVALLEAERASANRIAQIELNQNLSRTARRDLIAQENELLEFQKQQIREIAAHEEYQLKLAKEIAQAQKDYQDQAARMAQRAAAGGDPNDFWHKAAAARKAAQETDSKKARAVDDNKQSDEQFKAGSKASLDQHETEQALQTELEIEKVKRRGLEVDRERYEILKLEAELARKRVLNATPENRTQRLLDQSRIETEILRGPKFNDTTPHRDMNGRAMPSPAYKRHPDAYNGPGEGPHDPKGRPSQWQLDKPLQSPLQSGNGRLSDQDWSNQFKPLSEQAANKQAEQSGSSQADPLMGKIDALIGQSQTLVTTINELPSKVGVL